VTKQYLEEDCTSNKCSWWTSMMHLLIIIIIMY